MLKNQQVLFYPDLWVWPFCCVSLEAFPRWATVSQTPLSVLFLLCQCLYSLSLSKYQIKKKKFKTALRGFSMLYKNVEEFWKEYMLVVISQKTLLFSVISLYLCSYKMSFLLYHITNICYVTSFSHEFIKLKKCFSPPQIFKYQ